MAQQYSVYSLRDVQIVVNNPNVGRAIINETGGGRVVIGYNGELSSHTKTANGYVVINKLKSDDGTVTLDLPQNSEADLYMRKLIKYLTAPGTATNRFALTNILVKDTASGLEFNLTGCTPQKKPDENYDQQSGTRSYAFLVAVVNVN